MLDIVGMVVLFGLWLGVPIVGIGRALAKGDKGERS